MTEEEADRLSEQFRPSWEEDPPTVPRDQPVPAPPSAPQSRPASGPAVTTAPVVSITNSTPATKTPDNPVAARAALPLTVTPARKPTLVGTAPPTPAVQGATEPAPAEDLDWEVSTNPLPEAEASVQEAEAPVQIEVEELPPESKPSGIGQKYIPKEEGAPAVVLGAEVQAAESTERAKLEVEHRSRRAPTIIRMNAFELPKEAAPAPEPELSVPRKRNVGMMAALGVLVLGAAAAIALVVARGGSSPPVEPPSTASPPSAQAATVSPDTAAPAPPPALPAAEPSPSAPAPTSVAGPTPSAAVVMPVPMPEPSAPASAKPAHAPTVAAKTAAQAAKSAPKAAPVKTAAKPAGTSPKSSAKTSGKNTIVRETPF